MKKITILLLAIIVMSCVNAKKKQPPVPNWISGTYYTYSQYGIHYQHADDYNFKKHNSKKIKTIVYKGNSEIFPSKHDIVIYFTDGTHLNIHSYKYRPDITEY